MNEASCDIGSVQMPNATWLISAISDFSHSYGALHPYIALSLCITGTIMNAVTIVVLTRPSMTSPVNVLLCSVAICDVAVMTSYLVFVSHFHISAAQRCVSADYSYAWALFMSFHAHVSVIFHSTSIWLTVSLAQIRVLTISRATAGPTKNISIRFAAILSVVTCIVMALVNIPSFMTFKIEERPALEFMPCLMESAEEDYEVWLNGTFRLSGPGTNESVYWVIATGDECVKLKLAFWSNGMLCKMVPCILLTVSIISLLRIIAGVSNRRRSLAQVMKKRKMPKDHTTPMLVAVLSIFLIAELPQGIMLVLTGIFANNSFDEKVYRPLGDFMDLLSLINSAVNFLIYCIMSRKFRIVFLQLFFRCTPATSLRDMDECSRIQDGYDAMSRSRSRGDITRSEQLAVTSSHRPSATSMLLSFIQRDEAPSRKATGNLLSVVDPYNDRKSSAASCDGGRILSTAGAAHSPSIMTEMHEMDTSVTQLFMPVPGRQTQQKRKRREKDAANPRRKTSNLGFYASPRGSVDIERQFQESLQVLKKPFARLNPVAKLRKIFSRNATKRLPEETSPQRRLNLMAVETNGILF